MTQTNDSKPIKLKFDAVVVGGGMAGVCAAIEAARSGVKVALIQDRPVLGGVSSSEIGMSICGPETLGGFRYARDSGILEELRLTEHYRNPLLHASGQVTSLQDIITWEGVKQAGVNLLLNCSCIGVVMRDESHIEAVVCNQSGTEKRFHIAAKFFVDSTGDASVGHWAGAEWRYGREGRDEFDESLAPEVPDNKVLCSSLLFRAGDVGKLVRFDIPPWAKIFPKEKDLPYRDHKDVNKGYWWIEFGGLRDTIGDNQEIYEELLKRLFGVWHHIKNQGEHGADNLAIEWVSVIPGKRESRRLVGDYMISQQDLQEARLFDDRVAYGGWVIDFHLSEGIDSEEPPATNYFLQQPYSILLRSLYSRNIKNLLMAGRDISVTHVALMSTRVMGTCSTIGQAVGAALTVCVKYGFPPRRAVEENIEEIQQNILRHDGYIIGLSNNDPFDLARKAKVTSSSESSLEILHPDEWHPLDKPRSQIIALGPAEPTTIELLLSNRSSYTKDVEIEIGPARNFWDFKAQPIKHFSAKMHSDDTEWIRFEVNGSLAADSLARITLLANEYSYWGYTNQEIIGTCASFKNPNYPKRELTGRGVWYVFPEWRYLRGSYCMRFPFDNKPYKPANVINGVTRPEKGTNIWISELNSPLPQHIELEFPDQVTLRCIHLTFNTNLTPNINSLEHPVPECVKDYAIQYKDKSKWCNLLIVTDNYQRKRFHMFSPITTKKIRVQIHATNGSGEAGIYEIRVYENEIY